MLVHWTTLALKLLPLLRKKQENLMNQYLMLAIGLIVVVVHARRHQRSTIVANAMQAITISSISLPFLALEN
ncbi:hypothetical protein TSUD_13760, partial [Trifolium subterraneum]